MEKYTQFILSEDRTQFSRKIFVNTMGYSSKKIVTLACKEIIIRTLEQKVLVNILDLIRSRTINGLFKYLIK